VIGLAKDKTGKLEALQPTAFRSSSSASGHPASAAFDGFSNRYWAPKAAGPGAGEFVECDFETPVRVMKMIVFPGTSAKEDEFLTQARPAGITVVLTSADGERVSKTFTLRDEPGRQTFGIRGARTVRVRVTADAAYGGTGGNRRLAVAEIEFFGRRS
jgi:hypothetical protein